MYFWRRRAFMKKNRHFIMFIIMLIMMTMMATLATRQFPQTALVEVLIPYPETLETTNTFKIQNITDERLMFTKRYEVWQLFFGESEDIKVYEVKLDDIFYVGSGEFYLFSYDLGENAPEFVLAELPPGMYSLAKIYTFSDSEREHAVEIRGHMFIVLP